MCFSKYCLLWALTTVYDFFEITGLLYMSRMSSKVEQTTYDDFLKMTKSELEDFLAPRNLSCSGSKRELIARAFTAWELKIPIRISDEELQAKLRDEYNNRLKKHNLKDPKVYQESDWKKDVSQWPLVDLGKIFEYILDNREFGSDYIGKYKTQKAYSYFKSGFVSCIECVVDPELNGTILLRARVTPSQSVRDIPREIWIAAKASGQTLTAWCSCTAGYGQTCNHVISVLYKVEFAISNEYNEPSCTEKSSKWNDQTYRQVQPKKIKEMDIRSDNRLTNTDYDGRQTKRMSKLNFDPRRAGEDSVNETAIGSFLTGLSKISPQSVLFTGLSYQIGSQSLKQLPPTLIETAEMITAKGGATCDEDETRQFFETIKLDDGQVKKIEETTRAQRDSEDWKNQRLGRITASMCHTVHTKVKSMLRKPTKKQKVSPLVAEIVYGGPALDHLEAIKWGVEHEQDAKEAFYRSVSPNHRNFSIKQCGLHVHKDMPYIAASPDGIAVCDCCDRSVIEFKCPFKIKGKTVHEAYTGVSQ